MDFSVCEATDLCFSLMVHILKWSINLKNVYYLNHLFICDVHYSVSQLCVSPALHMVCPFSKQHCIGPHYKFSQPSLHFGKNNFMKLEVGKQRSQAILSEVPDLQHSKFEVIYQNAHFPFVPSTAEIHILIKVNCVCDL